MARGLHNLICERSVERSYRVYNITTKVNYLAKMQLKSSKAVLVLRHRAMPHNVLGQATRLHRG